MIKYPSNEELTKIATWEINDKKDFIDLMEYIHGLWAYANNGYWIRKGDVFIISTAGWSGNEDIIAALQENQYFWMMYWQQSTRGGHYIFGNAHDCLGLKLLERTSKTSSDNNKTVKVFCPNCEKDTDCTHEAELYVCNECGEDFAKYIVSRKPSDIEG